ncbi:MAG: Iron-sulfur cluster-binding protein [Labilithrix sp.]|nr:Iron-sulfur cluster-binding protein [Labilithrix sp.]
MVMSDMDGKDRPGEAASSAPAVVPLFERPTRREMLTRVGATAGVLAGSAVLGRAVWDRGGFGVAAGQGARQVRDYRLRDRAPDLAELAIAKTKADETPSAEALVRRAVDAMGGIKRFVSRGDVVVIKPNIGWDRMPIHAANTNPDVVGAVVQLAYEAGAKRVVVADGSCNDPNRCFQRSGIWRKAYSLGAEVVLPAEHRFRTTRMKGEVLDEWPIFTTLVDADKVINVPVAKHHNLAKYTAAMKNWYGVLGGRRNRLHQNIDTSIADLATFMRPTLVVVDAMRVLMRNGPQGGNIDDTKVMNQVFATVDQVAADAYGATLIGQHRDNLPYLKMGHERGLGTMYWEQLKVREV